jgi:hypothetical protein
MLLLFGKAKLKNVMFKTLTRNEKFLKIYVPETLGDLGLN